MRRCLPGADQLQLQRSVKDAIKQTILANDGDPDEQARAVLEAFAWMYSKLSQDREMKAAHSELLKELAAVLQTDARTSP